MVWPTELLCCADRNLIEILKGGVSPPLLRMLQSGSLVKAEPLFLSFVAERAVFAAHIVFPAAGSIFSEKLDAAIAK